MSVLDGIRILECAAHFNGPAVGAMLGDLGADVIKIEEPVHGDAHRGTSATLPGGLSPYFELGSRNKRSITLDLKKKRCQEVAYRLVKGSDVFTTNLQPSRQKQFGISYPTLKQYNPQLIYADMSGYGRRGPEAERPSVDPAPVARSGIMFAYGEYGEGESDFNEPVRMVGGLADATGAFAGAYGVLAALYARERTGIGQKIEASQFGAMLQIQWPGLAHALLLGRAQERQSRKRARNPLSNFYRCADGRWLMFAEPKSDRFWEEFCQLLGREGLVKDSRFSSAEARRQTYQELLPLVEQAIATKSLDQWLEHFKVNKAAFAYAPVQHTVDLAHDPQVLANDYVVDFEHPVLGKVKVAGFPVRFSETPAKIQRAAPELGQHTEEILLEAGYSGKEIADLRKDGVL